MFTDCFKLFKKLRKTIYKYGKLYKNNPAEKRRLSLSERPDLPTYVEFEDTVLGPHNLDLIVLLTPPLSQTYSYLDTPRTNLSSHPTHPLVRPQPPYTRRTRRATLEL